MKKIVLAVVLVLSGYAIGRASSLDLARDDREPVERSQPAPSGKVYEMRTYTATEGKIDAVNARFRDHTRRIFEKYNMKSVGYWVPTEGPMAGTTLIYILEHPSREAARQNWASFVKDPEWQKAKAESEANGPIVAKAASVFMTATEYSAIK